jgi:hypothetical protein
MQDFLSFLFQEVYTGQIPFRRYRNDFTVMSAVLYNKEIPDKVAVSHCFIPERLWELWMKCWDENPMARPSPAEALACISEIKSSSFLRLMSYPSRLIVGVLSRLDVKSILRCGEVSLFGLDSNEMLKTKSSHASSCIWPLKSLKSNTH